MRPWIKGTVLMCLLTLSSSAYSRAGAEAGAQCDHTIPTTVARADARSNYAGVKPGDIVCIAGGRRGQLTLRNFNEGLKQAPAEPITFINDGGQVVVVSTGDHGISIENSRYFRLTGSGTPDLRYGIKVERAPATGVRVGFKSTDFEVDHVEVTGVGVIGFGSGTEAVCSDGSTDWRLQFDYDGDGKRGGDLDDVVNRSNFTQFNSRFHDNYVHAAGTEGFYIGSSYYLGKTLDCASGKETVYSPVLIGVEVYDNVVEDTGWDGIQVGSAVEGCRIHHNHVAGDSRKLNRDQNTGIINNRGSACDIFNNVVREGGGTGIYLQGNGGNRVYNNLVIRPGRNYAELGAKGDGITAATGSNTGLSLHIWNNTLVYPPHVGISFSNDRGEDNHVQNNIIVGGQTPISTGGRHNVTVSHNLTVQTPDQVGFTDPAGDDYTLQPGSTAVDNGVNLGSQVPYDLLGTARPQGSAFDLGAYELVAGSPPIFADVPPSHPYFEEIETLYRAGYTAGCDTDPLRYCPDQPMTRAESAVFVERGIHGADVQPTPPTTQRFADLPLVSWAARWADAIYDEGYTVGCGIDPLIYCPWQGHTRAEGAVFFLRIRYGKGYLPAEPSGIFSDVPLDWWGAKWAEAAYGAGLIPACGEAPLRFCPDDPLTRGLAAHMLVLAKGSDLP